MRQHVSVLRVGRARDALRARRVRVWAEHTKLCVFSAPPDTTQTPRASTCARLAVLVVLRTMGTRKAPPITARTACAARLVSSRRRTGGWRATNAPADSLWRRSMIAPCATAALRLTKIRCARTTPRVCLASHAAGRCRWIVHRRNGAPSARAPNRAAQANRHGRARRCASRRSLPGAACAIKVRAQPLGVAARHAAHSSGAKRRTATYTSARSTALYRIGQPGILATRRFVRCHGGSSKGKATCVGSNRQC